MQKSFQIPAETKIDEHFPTPQFLLPHYNKPYRLNISDNQRWLLLYIKSHFPSRLLSIHNTSYDIQLIPFELNLRKDKLMFMCIYRPPKQSNQYSLEVYHQLLIIIQAFMMTIYS